MRVLIACECSGVVREAFRSRGHDAWSCDLKPASNSSPYHIQGDALYWSHRREWEMRWQSSGERYNLRRAVSTVAL
jgi:hypothetical protein